MVSNHRSFVVALVAAATLIVLAAEPGRAAKQLRWKLAAGDRFQVEMTQQTKQAFTFQNRTIEIPNELVMGMTWGTQGVDNDGVYDMTQTIDRVQMTMKPPGGGEVKFDSAAEEKSTGLAKMIGDMLRPMVGVQFKQKMNPRGQILDLQIPESALKGLQSNPLLKQFFSDDAFKRMMTNSSAVLPEQAIDKGFQWQKSTETDTPAGKMKMTIDYRYEGEEQRGDRMLDKVSAKITLGFAEAKEGGAQIKITDQDNSGVLYFDNAAGHLTESQMTQKISMEVTLGDRTMRQRIETTMRMTVQPVAP